MNENDGCEKNLILMMVALLCGPVNIFLLGISTGEGISFINFGLAPISMLLSWHLSNYIAGFRDLARLATGKKPYDDIEFQKRYARPAIPITIILFLLGGVFTGFRAKSFYINVLIYGIVGFGWAMLWFKMMQKGYLEIPDD